MEKERQGKWKWSFVDCSSPLPREIPCPLSSIVCARVGHHWKGVCNNKGERQEGEYKPFGFKPSGV